MTPLIYQFVCISWHAPNPQVEISGCAQDTQEVVRSITKLRGNDESNQILIGADLNCQLSHIPFCW